MIDPSARGGNAEDVGVVSDVIESLAGDDINDDLHIVVLDLHGMSKKDLRRAALRAKSVMLLKVTLVHERSVEWILPLACEE